MGTIVEIDTGLAFWICIDLEKEDNHLIFQYKGMAFGFSEKLSSHELIRIDKKYNISIERLEFLDIGILAGAPHQARAIDILLTECLPMYIKLL